MESTAHSYFYTDGPCKKYMPTCSPEGIQIQEKLVPISAQKQKFWDNSSNNSEFFEEVWFFEVAVQNFFVGIKLASPIVHVMTNEKGIFWVKVHLDPSVKHAFSPKVVQFWLELDPTCTIGTAIGKMKNGFGIAQDVAFFLEGYYLPTWMSSSMLVHAKEPLTVLPLKVDDSQLFAFNNIPVEEQPNPAQAVACDATVPQINSNTQPRPVITVTGPVLGTVTIPLNCTNTTLPVVSVGNSNEAVPSANSNVESMVIKPEIVSLPPEPNNNEPKSTGKRGRPARRKSQAPKTPDVNISDADQKTLNETTPTPRRRYTRRAAKAFAAAEANNDEANSANKRKAEDAEASSPPAAKRSRNSTPVLADPSPEKIRKPDGNTAPNGYLGSGSCSSTKIANSVSPQRVATNFGKNLDSLLFEVASESTSHTDVTTLNASSSAANCVISNSTKNSGTNVTNGNGDYVPADKKPFAQLCDLCPGQWITFQESVFMPTGFGADEPCTMNSVYYVESLNNSVMNLQGPDYDMSSLDVIQWKPKQLDFNSVSTLQIINYQQAVAKIYENWPLGALFNAIQS